MADRIIALASAALVASAPIAQLDADAVHMAGDAEVAALFAQGAAPKVLYWDAAALDRPTAQGDADWRAALLADRLATVREEGLDAGATERLVDRLALALAASGAETAQAPVRAALVALLAELLFADGAAHMSPTGLAETVLIEDGGAMVAFGTIVATPALSAAFPEPGALDAAGRAFAAAQAELSTALGHPASPPAQLPVATTAVALSQPGGEDARRLLLMEDWPFEATQAGLVVEADAALGAALSAAGESVAWLYRLPAAHVADRRALTTPEFERRVEALAEGRPEAEAAGVRQAVVAAIIGPLAWRSVAARAIAGRDPALAALLRRQEARLAASSLAALRGALRPAAARMAARGGTLLETALADARDDLELYATAAAVGAATPPSPLAPGIAEVERLLDAARAQP